MDQNEMHLASYRRYLRTLNRSALTIQDYEYRLQHLADHHGGRDLLDLMPSDLADYYVAVLEQQAATSAGIFYRSQRAFYNWAVREELIGKSPMAGMSEPDATTKPIPVLDDQAIMALLKTCNGADFDARRDTAMIRVFSEPGSPRVSEMVGMSLDDLDMKHDLLRLHGKGDKIRLIPFGAKTGQALDRYLRVRSRHPQAKLPALWLGSRGVGLTRSGIAQMLRRRARQAGIDHVYPHLLRHTSAHRWADADGSDQDAMVLFGWASPEMPRLYGRSAGEERARRSARRRSLGDRL